MCDFCQMSPAAFVRQLTALPRLRTVVVDYRGHDRDVNSFRDAAREGGEYRLVRAEGEFELAVYELQGPGLTELHITFRGDSLGNGPEHAFLVL